MRPQFYDEKMTQHSFSLPPSLNKRLLAIARAKHMSVSFMIRPLLEEFANKHYPEISDHGNLGDC